jgi:TusA-related sulfurtransferase
MKVIETIPLECVQVLTDKGYFMRYDADEWFRLNGDIHTFVEDSEELENDYQAYIKKD